MEESIKKIPEIELDNDCMFNEALTNVKYNLGRLTDSSNSKHAETYRQLKIIHENGVNNFWERVKEVLNSKKEIDINNVSDVISEEYFK